MEALFMSSELENRLLQYEKSASISTDEELIKAIECILSNEESLPFEERNFDLIEEAIDAVLSLQKIDIEQLEKSAEIVTNRYFSEIQTPNAKIAKKLTSKSVKIKWLIPIAAIISILVAGTIVAYAFGYDLIEMTKKAYAQLVEKESYEEGDYALIITSDHKEYHSLSEFLDNEEIDALLLPFDLPEEFNIDSIQVYDYGEYRKISLSILNNESDINISIKTPATDVVSSNEESKQIIGNYHVNYYQYDDIHQAEFLYEGSYYIVISYSYDHLEKIIESLRKYTQ